MSEEKVIHPIRFANSKNFNFEENGINNNEKRFTDVKTGVDPSKVIPRAPELIAGSMLPLPDVRLSPRAYEEVAVCAYKTMCEEFKVHVKATADIEKDKLHYQHVAELEEKRWEYRINYSNSSNVVYENSEKCLCLETVLPTGQRYTSKALITVPIEAVVIRQADTKKDVAVKFILNSEDCFFIPVERVSPKDFSAALRRHGIAIRANHNRKKEIADGILSFLLARAGTIYVPEKYGWYLDGDSWRFADERTLTLQEVVLLYEK